MQLRVQEIPAATVINWQRAEVREEVWTWPQEARSEDLDWMIPFLHLPVHSPPCSHLKACRAFLFCRRFSSSMGYSLKSSRPSRMRAMGAIVTSIFSVNLTGAGWKQPPVWYPAKLWNPMGRRVVRNGHLGPVPVQHCPRPPTHSLKTEGRNAQ